MAEQGVEEVSDFLQRLFARETEYWNIFDDGYFSDDSDEHEELQEEEEEDADSGAQKKQKLCDDGNVLMSIPTPIFQLMCPSLFTVQDLFALSCVDKQLFWRVGEALQRVYPALSAVESKARYLRGHTYAAKTNSCPDCISDLHLKFFETKETGKSALVGTCPDCGFSSLIADSQLKSVRHEDPIHWEREHRGDGATESLSYCAQHNVALTMCDGCRREYDNLYTYDDDHGTIFQCQSCDRAMCMQCSASACQECESMCCSECLGRYRGICSRCRPPLLDCANGCRYYEIPTADPVERGFTPDGYVICENCAERDSKYPSCVCCERCIGPDSKCFLCDDPICSKCTTKLSEEEQQQQQCGTCGVTAESLVCPECICGVCEHHLCADAEPRRCPLCLEWVHSRCFNEPLGCGECTKDVTVCDNMKCACGHVLCGKQPDGTLCGPLHFCPWQADCLLCRNNKSQFGYRWRNAVKQCCQCKHAFK